MKGARLNFAHICDYAFNAVGGKLCVIGIFKNINIRNEERTHPQMFVVTNISVESGKEYTQRIRLVHESDQEGDIVPEISFTFPVEKKEEYKEEYPEIGFIGQLNNVRFEKPGKYLLKIYIDDEFLKSIPVLVNITAETVSQ